MPLIRATFFFKDAANSGWTETIYLNVANLTLALEAAKALVPKRVALLGQNSFLVHLRVSDDMVKRDSQIEVIAEDDSFPVRGSQSELASDDLVIRLEAGIVFRTRRTLAMRGVPKNILGTAGRFIGAAQWNTRFVAWGQHLQQNHWAIKFRDKTVPVFNLSGAVQDVLTGIVTVTTQVAHGYQPGDMVFISGVAGSTELNGLWVILATPLVTTFTVKMATLMRPYILSGRCNANNYALAEINKVQLIRAATHKVGRPFDSLVGRRRGRTRR